MQRATLVGTLLPVSTRAIRVGLVVTGALAIALCSQIVIPLWFTPVPLTGQTFGVLLIAFLLGSELAVWSVGAYLSIGAMGLPVFAELTGGWARIAGPTGGYLIGFVLAAYLVGSLAERGWDRRVVSCCAAMLLGELVIYLPGLLWLGRFVPADKLLAMGLYPFIPGDLIKLALVMVALPAGWKLLRGNEEPK